MKALAGREKKCKILVKEESSFKVCVGWLNQEAVNYISPETAFFHSFRI
jgi:hypothetical protein